MNFCQLFICIAYIVRWSDNKLNLKPKYTKLRTFIVLFLKAELQAEELYKNSPKIWQDLQWYIWSTPTTRVVKKNK